PPSPPLPPPLSRASRTVTPSQRSSLSLLHRQRPFHPAAVTMQACLPRSYLTPVRDEEAESQRKARSRQARQTRRSTQGVTLAELKEAQRTFSLSPADRQKPEAQRQTDGPERRATEERGETRTTPPRTRDTQDHSPLWSRDIDELGNRRPRLGTQAETPTTPLTSPSAIGPVPFPSSSLTNRVSSRGLDPNGNEWRSECQSAIDSSSELILALRERQQARNGNQGASASCWTPEVPARSPAIYIVYNIFKNTYKL
ncbi:hypothetical protein JZ751_003690, partial [Albula glossodonta]